MDGGAALSHRSFLEWERRIEYNLPFSLQTHFAVDNMIDLSQSHHDMLAAIGASAGAFAALAVTDPRCLTEPEASFRLTGTSRDGIFPALEILLTQRFARVPEEIRMRDLLGPLKNALGNAHKHGNGRDETKRIRVEVHLTRRGACIAITDEGPGFDVRATLARFREEDHYYNNRGMGFRNFTRAESVLSYADGGRTLLLCFVAPRATGPRTPTPAPAAAAPLQSPEFLSELRAVLQRDPSVSFGPTDSMTIFGPRPNDPDSHRCILTTPQERFIAAFTLQTFPTSDAARAEYTAAHVMYESITRRKIRVPRPVACLEEPPLVVYDFAPSMDLWIYLADRGNLHAIEKMSRRLGIVLAKHHGTPLEVPEETWADTLARWAQALERAQQVLLSLDPTAAARLEALRASLLERVARAREESDVSLREEFRERSSQGETRGGTFDTVVHGSLGWDCLHYGVNGRFYLSRFQHCRKGHPALDLGGYLADLLAYSDLKNDPAVFREGKEALVKAYCDERPLPWIADLPLFIAGTLVERIAALAAWCAAERSPRNAETTRRPDWAAPLDPARLVALCARVLGGELRE